MQGMQLASEKRSGRGGSGWEPSGHWGRCAEAPLGASVGLKRREPSGDWGRPGEGTLWVSVGGPSADWGSLAEGALWVARLLKCGERGPWSGGPMERRRVANMRAR
jgi:hypothetical protein